MPLSWSQLASLLGPPGPEGPAGQPPANTVLSDPAGISGATAIRNIVVVTESAYGALHAEADVLYVVIADPEP